MVKVEVKGDRELSVKFKKNAAATPKKLKRAIGRSLALLERGIHRRLTGGNPLNVRTNRLRSSFVKKIVGGKNPYGNIGSNVIYARILNDGGDIRPVRAPYLHFNIGGSRKGGKIAGGKWIRTKHVRIPKHPYIEPTFTESVPKILRIFKRETDIK